MTLEQKAKAYDEVIERAKSAIKECGDNVGRIKMIESIFKRKLKEDNDERIRKEIISALKWANHKGVYDKHIAWLEKQGGNCSIVDIDKMVDDFAHKEVKGYGKPSMIEIDAYRKGIEDALAKQGWQKPFDYENANIQQKDFAPKVEPKFKVGDWIANDYCAGKVIALTDDAYLLDTEQGIPFSYEHNAHLWTIQDAKDGDVLYSLDSKQPFVFKHRKPNEQAVVYCGINTYGKFFIGNTKDCVITTDKYIPATKEQRDTLFKAIKDSGYEWDSEKKELKLLISNGGDFEPELSHKEVSKKSEQDKWSEEDEMFWNLSIEAATSYYGLPSETVNWLKSIKQRLL